MLRLTSLELSGFKSFALKTKVVFPEGVTAIVGPNGCGKSNLSDAIGWVLGASTARHLRGQRMEDVIFSGTKQRKQSGLCQVKLRLRRDEETPLNINGIELEGEEIELSRKLFRSGESHYFVNQKRCRLMDIQKFLQESGLGFASYAMIAQGKIDSFLTAKPLDRRTVIEEAAQITGYKAKRRNAELKLDMAEQNLLRVDDIIAEVERQLRSLKRQANKTRRYKKIKEEFRTLQRQRFKIESARLVRELEGLQGRLAEVVGREKNVDEALQQEESRQRAMNREREVLQERVSDLTEQRNQTELEQDRSKNSLRFHRQQIEQTVESIEALGSEQATLEESLASLEEELEQFEKNHRIASEEEARARQGVAEKKQIVGRCAQRVEEQESRLEEFRAQMLTLSAEIASLRNLREQLTQRRERMDADRNRLLRDRDQSRESLEEAREKLDSRKEKLSVRRATLEKLEERAQEKSREVRALKESSQSATEEVNDCKGRLVALQERLQSLQELELSRSHYSEGVKKVLRHLSKNQVLETEGTLADSLETDPEFERVVEEFLDEELEYILVGSLEQALQGVSEVRGLKGGKCTFLSVRSSNGFGKRSLMSSPDQLPQPGEGVYGRLVDVVRMKPETRDAFLRVLPKQAEAIVVSDMNRATELAHVYPESTFITLQGESLLPRGLVSGAAPHSGKLGLLGLKRQKRALEKKVEKGASVWEEARRRQEELEARLSTSVEAFESLRNEVNEQEKQVISLDHGVRQAREELERRQKQLEVSERELDQLELDARELEVRRERIIRQVRDKEAAQKRSEESMKAGRAELQESRQKLSDAQDLWNSVRSEQKILEERTLSLRQALERMKVQREEAGSRLKSLLSRREAGIGRSRDLKAKVVELQETLAGLEKSCQAVKKELADAKERVEEKKGVLAETERSLERQRKEKAILQEKRSVIEVDTARIETQLENLSEQCHEQLGLELQEACLEISLEGVDRDEVRERYEELKQKLDNFGPINMTALKEYQEHEERHTFLTEQKQDLEQSIADTTRAIQEINRRSRKQFMEAFEEVNANFKEVFQKLFGGGNCGMELLDEEDILECGIDLFAQPPGKKLQNVMLLSGGEKAMTVFALLVAIFIYRPSRFCVLDEVDAPLDDANVKRFGELVEEMSDQTQFIVVTHNKRTMEVADSLYGITMEEPGVSKVVSAQF